MNADIPGDIQIHFVDEFDAHAGPLGAKGIGESATVGSPAAVVNAVIDALRPLDIRHADIPLTPSRVWEAMQGRAAPPN